MNHILTNVKLSHERKTYTKDFDIFLLRKYSLRDMAYAEQITAKDLLDSLKNKISEMSGDQKVILQSFFEEIGSAYPLDFIVALMDGIDESDESIEYLQRLHQAADDLVSGNSQ